jgi:steroid delta-isomerase-like uncharacterized protein
MSKYRVLMVVAAAFAMLAIVLSLDSKQAKADDLAVIDDWIAAWNSHNPDTVTALFTADAVVEDVTFGVVNRGTDEIRAFAQFAFAAVPDTKFELVAGHLKGGLGTIEWVWSGTDVGIYETGKKFSVRGVTVLTVDGNKISRETDYWDLASVLRQLGLL